MDRLGSRTRGAVTRLLAGAAFALTLAVPAVGQGMDFQQLLSGKDVPHTLKLKELTPDWRRVTIGTTQSAKGGTNDMMSQLMQAGMMSDAGKNKGKNDPAAAALGMSLLGGLFGGGSKEPAAYTKGQTVTAGGETFLVVYRYQKPEMNLIQMAMESEKSGKEPDFSKMATTGKLAPDSPLTLSLINVKTLSSLDNIRPFDMDQEIIDSAREGGGLMELIAQEAAKDAGKAAKEAKETPKPAVKPAAARKPGAAK